MKRRTLVAAAGILAIAGSIPLSALAAEKTIVVGVTAGPHAEIMEVVKRIAEKQGMKIRIVEFNDFVQPNAALVAGDLDINSFQHKPYMDQQNEDRGYKLASAAAEVQEGNLDLARDRLVWVIEKSGHPEYDTIARVRLAGVELSAKKPEAALKVLEPAKPVPDQTALVEDRLGDVYYAMNDFEKARAAWQKAVEAAGEQSPIRGVLHYKLASLPPAAE